MIIIELPIVYALNYKEIARAEEQGIEVDPNESITMTTFVIPENCLIRFNTNNKNKRTSIYFDIDDGYEVDADYETVLEIIKREIKK